MSLCDLQNSQLLLVDIQERLVSAMKPKVVRRMVDNSVFLLQSAGILGAPVIYSEQYPKGLGHTLSEITAQIPESSGTLSKTCFSCTDSPDFDTVLDAGRDQVIIAGMESHVCILQTAMHLQQQGREVFVVADACAARSKHNHNNAMQRLAQAGIMITNSESVVFEWLRDTSHAGFKQISSLLKQRG